MKKSPFIWLGAGRAAKRGVARCGVQLDQAARARLPVPDGAILLDELFHIFLQEGVVEAVGDKVIVPDPIWLLEILYRDVRFPHLQTTADISVILAEGYDGPMRSDTMATGVDLENADQVAAALRKVWSYPAVNDKFRRDVLLLKQVMADTSGRALLLPDGLEDEIVVVSGAAEAVSRLPQLGRWQRPNPEYPPYARRLQMLLRGLRRTLGKEEACDFYWMDDGKVCWITLFN